VEVNAKNKSLRNPDLLPTQDKQRTLSLLGYTFLWAGMTINVNAFNIGAQYYNGGDGIGLGTLVWAVIAGYGIVTLLTVLVGDIGTRYGIPFAAYTRVPFGYSGAKVAGFIRAIPCFYWFGFQTWAGAVALNKLTGIIFPGFDHLTIMIIVFGALQIINAAFGLEAMAKFDYLAIPLLSVLFAVITVGTFAEFNIAIPDIMAIKANGNYSFAFAVTGIAGGWITMSLNGSDLTRQIQRHEDYDKVGFFKRNDRAILGQVIGLMLVGIIGLVIGFVAGVFSGEWDINQVITVLFNDKVFLFVFCLVCVVFAQWSTNTVANLMPPTYILMNIIPKLSFPIATVISGVIGIAMQPWNSSGGDFLVQVQAKFGLLLAPIAGILVADYYFIRKTKLNVHDIYVADGEYKYFKGFNISALIALAVSFVVASLSGDLSFYVSFVSGLVIYLVLMKTVTLKKYKQSLGVVVDFDETK